MPYIQIQNLKKRYVMSKNIYVDALKDVTFDIKKGEFLSVVGASGSGKSTLLNILGGLDREYTGSVYVNGKDIKEYNSNYYRRYIVGTVFQQFNLIPSLNVKENILLPLKFGKKKNINTKERLNYLLEITLLEKRVHHLPNELSGGEMQRVAIARALINSPEIILADEPTGNLDSKTGESIIKLLTDLNRNEKVTIVLITHDNEIAKRTDRTITLVDGKNV
ncbi:MAG TPA: ABC transporter ATP-binding protein [Candidatus Dojkabacteria bacterium]|nr:ABC transporter ATP-binding protein [Candidatus Dojkabacteria bacterium]